MICDLVFPTPIWHDKLKIDTQEILNFCVEKNNTCHGRKVSNINGWQSNDFLPEDNRLLNLTSSIYERSAAILEEFKYDHTNLNLKIYNMWVNINYPGSSNKVHIHHNSILSGVFYVKCDPNSGDINFHRNFSDQFSILSMGNITKNNYLNYSGVNYQPEIGKLILFPSWIPHSVDVNKSQNERISLSFNIGFCAK